MLKEQISVKEAKSIILSQTYETEEEEIIFSQSLGRYTSREIKSPFNIPNFDNSAMDGFAVKSSILSSASPENPVKLKIVDEIWAGKIPKVSISSENCVKIYTGAIVPEGADAIVRKEDVSVDGDMALFKSPVEKGYDIRKEGEEIKKGEIVINKGYKITSSAIGLLASLMIKKIRVFRKPKVLIIATGSELIDIEESFSYGKIVNSNSYALISMTSEYGAEPVNGGIVKDSRQSLKECFKKIDMADVVITTGGVSVGDYDLVKDVFGELGVNWHFWKVRMRPGHPVAFGTYQKKLFFALPGNPVSAMVTYDQFVLPAIKKMLGVENYQRKTLYAIVTDDIKKKADRTHFLRGKFYTKDGQLYVDVFPNQSSSAISSMINSNCYVILEEGNTRIKRGEKALIELFES
ncbi:MAG: molybdopterin molybdotransferase MoeA [Proteobacteria bacterium]|nr:molybdopterin molybdotransferase MoeA [Pseudomonadota bacterium]